jgi:hypothetical protein
MTRIGNFEIKRHIPSFVRTTLNIPKQPRHAGPGTPPPGPVNRTIHFGFLKLEITTPRNLNVTHVGSGSHHPSVDVGLHDNNAESNSVISNTTSNNDHESLGVDLYDSITESNSVISQATIDQATVALGIDLHDSDAASHVSDPRPVEWRSKLPMMLCGIEIPAEVWKNILRHLTLEDCLNVLRAFDTAFQPEIIADMGRLIEPLTRAQVWPKYLTEDRPESPGKKFTALERIQFLSDSLRTLNMVPTHREEWEGHKVADLKKVQEDVIKLFSTEVESSTPEQALELVAGALQVIYHGDSGRVLSGELNKKIINVIDKVCERTEGDVLAQLTQLRRAVKDNLLLSKSKDLVLKPDRYEPDRMSWNLFARLVAAGHYQHVQNLDMSGLHGLTSIPAGIFELPDLRILVLNGHGNLSLDTLAEAARNGKLQQLRKLYVGGLKDDRIPDEIRNLPALKSIHTADSLPKRVQTEWIPLS